MRRGERLAARRPPRNVALTGAPRDHPASGTGARVLIVLTTSGAIAGGGWNRT
ncbi:hypothetical protein AB3662_42600 [Sorangium cellulosum]|uniref:hypothetical protein n=1 Tax=Sorangium cellulosum TaxID=56 RepID=UPI003D9A361B